MIRRAHNPAEALSEEQWDEVILDEEALPDIVFDGPIAQARLEAILMGELCPIEDVYDIKTGAYMALIDAGQPEILHIDRDGFVYVVGYANFDEALDDYKFLLTRFPVVNPKGRAKRTPKPKTRGKSSTVTTVTTTKTTRTTKKGNPPKALAFSKDRYSASAEERRRYGGNIVTEFYVMWPQHRDEASEWEVITGYGKTASDRKKDAIAKFLAKKGRSANPPTNAELDVAARSIRSCGKWMSKTALGLAAAWLDGVHDEKTAKALWKHFRQAARSEDVRLQQCFEKVAFEHATTNPRGRTRNPSPTTDERTLALARRLAQGG